jgi:hypothetical protein
MDRQAGYKSSSFDPSLYPFTGFMPRKSIRLLGQIELLMTYGDAENHRMELVRFDVVDLESCFNAIMGRNTLNCFCVIVHHNFLFSQDSLPTRADHHPRHTSIGPHRASPPRDKVWPDGKTAKSINILSNIEEPPVDPPG